MSTFALLGLGESLSDYSGKEDFSIGVNDIWKFHKTDYVVCVDPPERFSSERLKTINECKPIKFFSHLEAWSTIHNFNKIDLRSPRGTADYYSDKISYGIMSPLSAMILACKLGATSITVYGVDLATHPRLTPLQDKAVKHLKEFVFKCPVPVWFSQKSPMYTYFTH